MIYPYKTRKGGATITVFTPYDCGNHCPFCINKGEYADTTGFDVNKIVKSLKLMDEITPECDIVFTGGEPFADREALQTLLDAVTTTHRVFINSTLPVFEGQTEDDIIAFTEHNKDKITCINVSRHLRRYVTESGDELISKLAVQTRVNCVLYEDYPSDKLEGYVQRWLKYGVPVQFRYDYTATTLENLYDTESDPIIADLEQFAEYKGLDGCRMRCGFHYDYKGLELTYHKTLPYSTILEKDEEDGKTYAILYDLIIKQNGDIHSDWDDRVMDYNLDIEAYRNVKYEPYDMRVIEGDITL